MLKANSFPFLITALALSLSACASNDAAPMASYEPGSKITIETASNVTTFDPANITSVVDYYFASRIRGDDNWAKVMPPQEAWSDELKSKLAKHDKWTFLAYQLQEIDAPDANSVSVDVEMTLSFEGDTESGVDNVILQQEDGKWMIVEVPT